MEKWKDISGYEGKYQVSNTGKIKSIGRWVNVGGDGKRYVRERILRPGITIWGYNMAGLCGINGRGHLTVHRIVAKAFIQNPLNLPCINHKNGIKLDNRVENLEWCTQQQNCNHALQTGLLIPAKGERNGASTLKENQVIEIKRLLKSGTISQYRIAKNFGVHKMTINDIKQNKTWKHIL